MGQLVRNSVLKSAFLLLGLLLVTCSDYDYVPTVSPELTYPNNQLMIGLDRTDWQMSSRPMQVSRETRRVGLLWHTPVEIQDPGSGWDVTGRSTANAGVESSSARTLRVIFRPTTGEPSWGGIVTRFAYPVSPDSVQGIELRALGDHGVVHIDLGLINDDVNGDGFYWNEDLDHNGVVDDMEDVGLDGLADRDEPGYDPVTNPDPNGDDFFFRGYGKCPVAPGKCDSLADAQQDPLSSSFYEYLNGTEGNRDDLARLGEPDHEWVGKVPETENDYFSISIHLADKTYVVPGSEDAYGWKTIRVPAESVAVDTVIGSSRTRSDCWRDINRIRIWFESDGGSSLQDTIEIAGMYILQNVTSVDSTGSIVVHEYMRDYEYEDGRVFDLGYVGELGPYDTVTDVRMFQTGSTGEVTGDPVDCLLQIYPDSVDYGVNPPDDPYAAQRDSSAMIEVMDFQYFGWRYSNRDPYVVLGHARGSGEMLGCWMVVRRYSADGDTFLREDTVGDVSDGNLYVLKSLRGDEASYSPSHATWDLMWRNAYPVRRNTWVDDLNLRVFKGLVGTEGDPANPDHQVSGSTYEGSFIRILGLDQYNRQNQRVPDGIVDDRIDVFRPDQGLIIFPSRRPFDSDTIFEDANGSSTTELAQRVPQVYDGSTVQEQADASVYYLSSTWRSSSPVILLGRTNIQEGSERVSVKGRLLVRGTDYNIDYLNGILVFLGPEADYLSAEIVVTYVPHPKFR